MASALFYFCYFILTIVRPLCVPSNNCFVTERIPSKDTSFEIVESTISLVID